MIKALFLMLVLGALVGAVLGFASIKFHVEPDHRAEELLAMLPGYNCGGCGYPGCSGMASALADGDGDVDKCKPSKAEAKAAIKQYLKDHPKEA
ncbi:MAG: RnfABCDGE type electron transport complex subunit B [Solobacterium sp.]|nr:RnfABCDGE type electron transport complex subunit B [Solobacterium sp.]MBR2769828.1 RnfABCDGE type electron transport complex subunit B [Solobacterium sp.]MBR2793649.1 RnfABCDGE type electron transport complex subunit B [Solobacterium sp.]